MKNGSSIIISKKLKIWKLYVTNKIALVKDEDFPFLNQIPFFFPTKIFRLKSNSTSRHFTLLLWRFVLLCDWIGSHLDFYNVNTSSF